MKECDTVDLSQITSPSDYLAAANSSETVEKIEKVVQDWIKQIEQVGFMADSHGHNFDFIVIFFTLVPNMTVFPRYFLELAG